MKAWLMWGVAMLFVLGTHALSYPSLSSATVTGPRQWTGEISASSCGVLHKSNIPSGECTRLCVDRGADYILLSEEAVYVLRAADPGALRAHAGETVTVTGELKGNVITPTAIETIGAGGGR